MLPPQSLVYICCPLFPRFRSVCSSSLTAQRRRHAPTPRLQQPQVHASFSRLESSMPLTACWGRTRGGVVLDSVF